MAQLAVLSCYTLLRKLPDREHIAEEKQAWGGEGGERVWLMVERKSNRCIIWPTPIIS